MPYRKQKSIPRQQGFTLIELMIVVTIVGVLSVVSVPHFRAYVLEARLNDALPKMTEIVAKMRMMKLEKGKYCCSGDSFDEAVIASELQVNVAEAGDFCFMIMCPGTANCLSASPGFFTTSPEPEDAPPEFEVIALLRASTAATINSPLGQSCKAHPQKRPPTGWVADAASGQAGREGRMLILRYPPPRDGIDGPAGSTGDRFVWQAGFSKTNAMKK